MNRAVQSTHIFKPCSYATSTRAFQPFVAGPLQVQANRHSGSHQKYSRDESGFRWSNQENEWKLAIRILQRKPRRKRSHATGGPHSYQVQRKEPGQARPQLARLATRATAREAPGMPAITIDVTLDTTTIVSPFQSGISPVPTITCLSLHVVSRHVVSWDGRSTTVRSRVKQQRT